MLSFVKGIKPRDQIEAMFAIQMASVHMAVVKNSRSLEHFDTLQEVDSVGGFFIKLARTFTTQMEALQRYRTGGEQKVTLQQNVSVSGGQAIVGTVNQNSGGESKANKAMRPAITEARCAPMTIIEGNEQPVAVPDKLKPRQ